MMQIRVFLSLAVALVLSFNRLGAQVLTPEKDIERLLGVVAPEDSDLWARQLGDLMKAASSAKQPDDALAIDTLARHCSSKADIALLTVRMTDQMKLGAYTPEHPDFGSALDRYRLYAKMYARSRLLSVHDAEAARRVARTLLLLSIADRTFVLTPAFKDLAEGDAPGIAQMDESGRDFLLRMQDARKRSSELHVSNVRGMVGSLEAIIRSESPSVDPAEAKKFLDTVEAAWAEPEAALRNAYKICNLVWRFANVARHKNDVRALESVKAVVTRLKGRTHNEVALGWLSDILEKPGPMPDSTGVQIIDHPQQWKPPIR